MKTEAEMPEVDDTASESDEALGVGQPSVEDITSSRAFHDAVAEAVKAALAQQGPALPMGVDATAFMAELKQLTQAFQVQSPGYNKPLPPEEVARREAGRVEFVRLIGEAVAAVEEFGRQGAMRRGLVPEYLIGPNGFFTETDQGEELFSPGQRIFLTKPPPKDFEPLNAPAGEIMAAQMRWLGLDSPGAEEMVRRAVVRASGGDPSLEDEKRDARNRQFAEVVSDAGAVAMGPSKIMGATVAGEADDGRGRFAITKGQVARPVSGPVFA